MAYEDKKMTCKDCGGEFVWTAGEQEFYAQKGFANAPSRCADCRKKWKDQKRAGQTMHKITCAKCGKEGEVPFEPRDPSSVLCADCFREDRGSKSE